MTAEEVAEAVLQGKPFYEASVGGVTLSGGEPLLYPDFCADVFTRLKAYGIGTAIDTSAAVGRRAFLVTAPVTDLYLVDVKHPFSDAHRALTGFGNEAVWENLSLLTELSKDVEIRIPIIPGVNDGDAEIRAAAGRLREIPAVKRVRLLPYRDLARSKYEALGMQDTMPHAATPTPEEMEAHRIRFASYGLETVV
jgi:pyruvate formate lyase activating enzyme